MGLLLLFWIPGWLLSPEMNDAELFTIGSYSLRGGEGGSNFPIMDQLSSVEEKSWKLLPHCRYQFSLHIRFDVRRSLFALLAGLVLFPNQKEKKLFYYWTIKNRFVPFSNQNESLTFSVTKLVKNSFSGFKPKRKLVVLYANEKWNKLVLFLNCQLNKKDC